MLDTLLHYFYYPGVVTISMGIVFGTMPSILHVCCERKLFDDVGFRKMHDKGTPRLGGLAMFFSFMVTLLMCTHAENVLPIKAILVASMCISFVSLKDDLVGVGAYKKLIVHIFVSALLVVWGGIKINNLHGILGIYKLDYVSGLVISIGFITYIINAFNLIDGIDGLAGCIGLLGSLVFGMFFILSGQVELASVALCLSGAIGGFLWYNFNPAKVFMGDTGAYLVGIILSVLAIRFIEINPISIIQNDSTETSPAIAIAILIVPVFDTIRVTLIRISRGQSPFKADNNHIHHKLKNAGMSHSQIVATLLLFNLMIIFSAYFVHDFGSYFSLSFMLIECLLFNVMTSAMLNTKKATRFSFRNFLW